MADERFKPDANFKASGVVGGYASTDAIGATSPTLIAVRIDSTTGRLLVDINDATAVTDNEAVSASDTGYLALGTDTSNYQVLRVDSDGHLQVDILSGGGGTEYSEDDATPATIAGLAIMIERDDALATLTPVEGDWVSLRSTAEGALWVQDFNSDAILADTNAMVVDLAAIEVLLGTIDADTGAIKTAVEVIDNAISGSEMQVDIVADGAGLATAANQSTMITSLQLLDDVIYTDDDDWTDSTSKHLLVGGLYQSSPQTVTDGDVAPLLISSQGRLQVDLVGIPDLMLGTDFSSVFGTASLVSATPAVKVEEQGTVTVSATNLDIRDLTNASDSILIYGSDDGGTTKRVIKTDSGGAIQIDLETANVTNAGTFAVQVDGDALTALQLIDNIVVVEDAVHGSGDSGVMALAVRNDTLAALVDTDGDYAPLQVNASGALYIDVADGGTLESLLDGIETVLGTIDTDTGNIATSLAALDNAVDGNYLNVNANIAGTDIVGGAGAVAAGVQRVTLASDDPAVVDLAAIEVLLGTIDADTSSLAGAVSGSEVQVDVVAALPAGTNAIGKLAANSGVDIGDVDILSIIPGTGATNLGKAEDAAHSSGDTGVMALAVRDTSPAAVSGTDGDYEPLHVNDDGGAWVTPTPSHTGGNSFFSSIDLDESEEQVSATACTVTYMYFWNATAAPLWVQLFNATAASIAPGTDAPDINFPIPANADSDVAGVIIPVPQGGVGFSTALSVAVTTGSGTNAGAPGANEAGGIIFYKN